MAALHVLLEERDYVKAARAAAIPSRRTILALAVASIGVVVGAFVGWHSGYMREAFIAGFVWFFGLAGAAIGHMLSIPPRAKRVFRQQHGLQRPYEVTWNEGGLTMTGAHGTATTPWPDFHKWRELDDQFILFLSDAVFFMIPKRAFPDNVPMRDFRELITTKIQRR